MYFIQSFSNSTSEADGLQLYHDRFVKISHLWIDAELTDLWYISHAKSLRLSDQHSGNVILLVLARGEIRKHRADNEWKGQKRKRSNRQLAIAEGPAVQEGLEQFQRENEVHNAQDVLPIDPALSGTRPRVRAPPRCSDCHNLGHRRLQCPNRVPN
jgi:hypothetical protein